MQMKFCGCSKLRDCLDCLLIASFPKLGMRNRLCRKAKKLKKIKRVYHHYQKCEEYKTDMWRVAPIEARQELQEKSASLMKDVNGFEAAMMKVVDEWEFSCEANLSASVINHQAWMGHAGCAINHNAPEDITRLAWRTLTSDEQDKANAAADRAIAAWRKKYLEKLNA